MKCVLVVLVNVLMTLPIKVNHISFDSILQVSFYFGGGGCLIGGLFSSVHAKS